MAHPEKHRQGAVTMTHELVPRRLRIGLLTRPDGVDAEYQRHLVRALRADQALDVVTVVVIRTKEPPTSVGLLERWLLRTYAVLDRYVFSLRTLDAHVAEPAEAPSSTRDTLEIGDSTSGDLDAGVQRLVGQELDVIVNLSPGAIPDSLRRAARLGVWWIGPAPVLDRDTIAEYRLFATAEGNGPLIESVWAQRAGDRSPALLDTATIRAVSNVSVEKNGEVLRAVHPCLLLSSLRRAAPTGSHPGFARDRGAPDPPDGPRVGDRRRPARAIGSALFRIAGRQIRHRAAQHGRSEEWRVGTRSLEQGDYPRTSTAGYSWVPAPRGHWYADPFLLHSRGREWLFIEDFDIASQLGTISVAEISPAGGMGRFEPVLARPYHLSYPCVFEHGREVFMIPETGFNDTVELYRAADFPHRWEFVRVLHRGAAFDTTPLFHQDRFWFFTSLMGDRDHLFAQLSLFSSDRVDGDWVAHPANPLSLDSRFARNAGHVLFEEGKLIRCAQDGSRTYGGSVQFRQIDTLNEHDYAESPAGQLEAGLIERGTGLHTYNRGTRLETIDVRVIRNTSA